MTRTSRSAVVRGSPKQVVTTNPPRQWKATCDVSVLSRSSKKPFQGSDRLARIRKVFRNKIRQQVPVARFRRTFVQQPAPLRRSHRFAAQRVFSYQPRALEFLLDPSELHDRHLIAALLGKASRERHHKSQSVLNVLHFRSFKQPFPVEVRVMHDDPGERFSQPCFQIRLRQC